MKSGMVAAEAIHAALEEEGSVSTLVEPLTTHGVEAMTYRPMMEASWVWSELHSVRNYAPAFKWGLWAGVIYSGLSAVILQVNAFIFNSFPYSNDFTLRFVRIYIFQGVVYSVTY